MAKAEASVEELVGMIERGELRLPEMQRQYVWRSTRVRVCWILSIAATPPGQSCSGRPMKTCHCRRWRLANKATPTKQHDCF